MLSRLAEALYWFGRYLERAENTARLLDVNYYAIAEAPLAPYGRGIVAEQWAPLLAITDSDASFREHFDRADASSVPAWLTVHPENPASIRSSLTFARANARTVRDRISTEMWEAVNRTYLELANGRDEAPEEDALHDYCVAVRDASHLVLGIAHATLPRDLGWYFVRAGQYVERADTIVRMLSVRTRHDFGTDVVAAGLEAHRSMAMLKSTSAYEAYRKRHRRTPTRETIAAFLLLEPDFPRSLRYCLTMLDEVLGKIAIANPGADREAQRQAGWLAARIAYCPDVRHILDDGEPSLDDLLDGIGALSDEIGRTYFLRS
jgi:uncharacterized alpha-E superfamily protein